jgi:hypothetical protein
VTGVCISPNQSARLLSSNLVNLSPNKRISPKLLRNMKRQVVKVRAELTLEQLDSVKIDDSFGSLVRYADSKWLRVKFHRLYLSSIMIEAMIFISTWTTYLLLVKTSMQQRTSFI